MSLERILTDYGEPLQYLIYFGFLAGLEVPGATGRAHLTCDPDHHITPL